MKTSTLLLYGAAAFFGYRYLQSRAAAATSSTAPQPLTTQVSIGTPIVVSPPIYGGNGNTGIVPPILVSHTVDIDDATDAVDTIPNDYAPDYIRGGAWAPNYGWGGQGWSRANRMGARGRGGKR